MSELIVAPYNHLLDGIMHNPEETGWHFSAGNPEFWRYTGQLVVPGGKVLDIGMEYGRSSFYFATQGMSVEGLDVNPYAIKLVQQATTAMEGVLNFDITARVGDAFKENLGENIYDLVLLDHTLLHQSSKSSALELIDKAYRAVKPNGHLWIRALGKETDRYHDMREAAECGDPMLTVVDEDVIEHPCSCSGEYRFDPSLFFGQTDLLQYMTRAGARIVHSQLMPEDGRRNIMYGEDFNPGSAVGRAGMITVLAQKV